MYRNEIGCYHIVNGVKGTQILNNISYISNIKKHSKLIKRTNDNSHWEYDSRTESSKTTECGMVEWINGTKGDLETVKRNIDTQMVVVV